MKQIAMKCIQAIHRVFPRAWEDKSPCVAGGNQAHLYTCTVQRSGWGDIFPWKGEECSLQRQHCLTVLAPCSRCPSKACGDLLWCGLDNKRSRQCWWKGTESQLCSGWVVPTVGWTFQWWSDSVPVTNTGRRPYQCWQSTMAHPTPTSCDSGEKMAFLLTNIFNKK